METAIVKKLFKKIHDKDLLLAIIGSGYVGLPTAALFADAGFTVTAMDLNSADRPIEPNPKSFSNSGTVIILPFAFHCSKYSQDA
jgi:hypothetical protein